MTAVPHQIARPRTLGLYWAGIMSLAFPASADTAAEEGFHERGEGRLVLDAARRRLTGSTSAGRVRDGGGAGVDAVLLAGAAGWVLSPEEGDQSLVA
jgi:hypothetical protein